MMLGGLLAAAVGCRSTPDHQVDGWAVARAALLDGRDCYAGEPAYCIDDPAVVDAAIKEAVTARAGGSMPSSSRKVDAVVKTARTKYRERSRTDAGLRAIEARVAAAYAAPRVDLTSDPATVAVDLGAPPGTLAIRGRGRDIQLATSAHVANGQWVEREAGRILHEYARRHPERDVVRASVVLAQGSGLPRVLVYRYLRRQDRVVFGEEGASSLRVLSLAKGAPELAAGAFSWASARHCTSGHPELPSDCPTADPVARKRREASRRASSP